MISWDGPYCTINYQVTRCLAIVKAIYGDINKHSLADDPVERRRSLNQPKAMDVDLRQQQPQFPPADPFGEDNSQDGMNANIKTIVAQAQEQMEKGEITPEQYNILMKQVIQLNETQKIRQAQRMEMMKRQQIIGPMLPDDNANSHSGEEMASFSPNINDDGGVKPNVPAIAGGGPVVSNDFRGKITPVDTTSSKVEPQFGNSGPIGDIRIRGMFKNRIYIVWYNGGETFRIKTFCIS